MQFYDEEGRGRFDPDTPLFFCDDTISRLPVLAIP